MQQHRLTVLPVRPNAHSATHQLKILCRVKEKFSSGAQKLVLSYSVIFQPFGLLVCLCYPETLFEVIASFLNCMVFPVVDTLLHVYECACLCLSLLATEQEKLLWLDRYFLLC